jgi:hypothetical protein
MNWLKRITLSQIWLPVVLLAAWLLRVIQAQQDAFTYDEGIRLMFGALTAQGYAPYTEVFVGIPPLALMSAQWGPALFGNALSARHPLLARYPTLLFSLVGVTAVFWLVKRQTTYYPLFAGLLAAMLVAFGPSYLFLSTSLNMEVPALAFALLSVALAERYRSQPAHRWLLLSGVAFGLSLASKVLVVFLPLLIGIQLLAKMLVDERASLRRGSTYVGLIKMGVVWLSGAVAILVFFLIIYEPAEMYQQVIAFRLLVRDAAVAAGEGMQENITTLKGEIGRFVPLMVAALVGLGLLGKRGLTKAWIWPLWFVVAVLFLLSHIPLRPRHSIILLPPLAALSGLAVTSLMALVSHRFPRWANWLTALIFVAALGWALSDPLYTLASSPRKHAFDERHAERLSAITFVQQTTTPSDCIVVDDQRFTLRAERLSPPYLSEITTSRLSVGWLSAEEIIDTVSAYECPVIVFMTDRFDTLAPAVRPAAMSLFSLGLEFSNPEKSDRTTVYAVKMNTSQAPSQVLNRSLGGQLLLKGIDVTPSPWRPGQEISISTYWQAQRRMGRDYKMFVHLVDTQNRAVATFDHYPFESSPDYMIFDTSLNARYLEGHVVEDFADYPATGLIPTRLWIPGNTLKETITITWPETISPGTYTLTVGMYDESTMERLAVHNDLPGSDNDPFAVADIRIID